MGSLSERYQGYGVDIHASGIHLLDLISQILDLSKVEAGRMELDVSEFAPDLVAAGCRRFLEGSAAKVGVALEVDFPPSLPALMADEIKFKQVLLNLASNAIKFTPKGGKVRVSARADVHGLIVTVSDTGVGMHADDIPRALQPFQQVCPDKTRTKQGTGLGLPLAKAFVELHGGSLAIESEPERGTTVTVVFPPERVVYNSYHRSKAVESARYGSDQRASK